VGRLGPDGGLNFLSADREVFGLLFLDKRHRYLGHQQLFTGTIDGASVHPREVARSVFEYNAAAVIALHCHPSGVGEPSKADELITQRLKSMLELIDVRLLDHLLGGFLCVTTAVKIHQSLGFCGVNGEQRIQ
jgi:DNA repair protein RadC